MGIDVVVGTSMSAAADDGPTIRAAAIPVAVAVQMADLRLSRTCGCCCDQAWIRVDAIEIKENKKKQKRVVVVMAIMLVVLRRLERRYSEWPVMVVVVVVMMDDRRVRGDLSKRGLSELP
jgi:mannose/fructose/N-acetylgalactosamine-specific phosphotransferase system component IIC